MKKLILAGMLTAILTTCLVTAQEGGAKATPPASTLGGGATMPFRRGSMKVLVNARVNNGGTTSAMTSAMQPANGAGPGKPAGGPPGGRPPGGAPPAGGPPGGGPQAGAGGYTHTNSKTISVTLVNTTRENLDVDVKVTFLAQDQGAKHEIVPEKTVESKHSILVGKSDQFTTEEVSFTHSAAHLEAKAGGGGGGGGQGAPPKSLTPASGHIYSGYKVEVYQGADLVGSAGSNGVGR